MRAQFLPRLTFQAIHSHSRRLNVPEPDVLRLICQAEEVAFDRGWKPPLAA